jgi:hypothetical protein
MPWSRRPVVARGSQRRRFRPQIALPIVELALVQCVSGTRTMLILPQPVGQRDHVGSAAAIAHRTAMTRLNYDSTGEPGANIKQERGDHLGNRTVLARVIERDYRPRRLVAGRA